MYLRPLPDAQNGETTVSPREEGDIMHSKADQIQDPQQQGMIDAAGRFSS